MKRIAIVTGATGGLGYAFLKELMRENLDEVWALGRNEARLAALRRTFGARLVPIRLDFTEHPRLEPLAAALAAERPVVDFLVNNAGVGRLAAARDMSAREIRTSLDVNCTAPAVLVNLCLPYMARGSRILNVASAAAFQPLPYLNLYAATKAFLFSYSRALGRELRPLGIAVTTVCPGWIRTPLIPDKIKGRRVHYPGLVDPTPVARCALRDAKRGRDMSVCSLFVKAQRLAVKLMPQCLTMDIWQHGVDKYR